MASIRWTGSGYSGRNACARSTVVSTLAATAVSVIASVALGVANCPDVDNELSFDDHPKARPVISRGGVRRREIGVTQVPVGGEIRLYAIRI